MAQTRERLFLGLCLACTISLSRSFGNFDCGGTGFSAPVLIQESDYAGPTHATISVRRHKCLCASGTPSCSRVDPTLGLQEKVHVYYSFQAVIKTANEGTITNANKEGTIAKVGELFQAHQEARSSDIAGGSEERNREESSTKLGASITSDFPAFTGFGPNFCADWPMNSMKSWHPGPAGHQTLWSTEDGSCLDTVSEWEYAKTKRGKDDPTNPCSGLTANHNVVAYYDDWLSWVPKVTCKPADESTCGDWGVKDNHQITSFGDIIRMGWGDAMSISTGQDPAGVQNIPGVGAVNYPLFLNYLKDKIRLMGCPESELPFRVTLGRHTDWWIGSYGIKNSDMTKAHIIELSFPCGGPSWSTNCVAPPGNDWRWTTFRFAMQIQVGSAATGSAATELGAGTGAAAGCIDTPDFTNGHNHGCASYASRGWCANGGAAPGNQWTLGAKYKYPEKNCCVCGKPASDFPAFTGFGPNFCSDYPINSAQRGNPGPQGWQTLWSTEDGSCLDTVNVWEPAKTERGKDDATNPCSGVTANHNAVVYYDDWLSWVPEPTCKTAYGDDSKCSDWGVKVNHQITSFGDIMRIGWGDAMSTSTGQDPAGVQNIPNVGAINYPLFLNYLKDKFRLMGCPESELPFRVTLGRHTDWWVGSYGIKKSDMTKAHILELSFPCGGPSWSTNCVAPTQEVANKWWWTTFRFAMQIQVGSAATGSENGENWSVLGKGSSVPLYTWGCGSNGVKGRPTPLSFCNGGTNGPLHYDKLDSIIREAIAHARFEIAKTLAHGGSTTETYDNCADTINCGATYNNIYNRCHHREFTQDPRIPLEYCKKSCALHGGTGNC